MLVKKGDNLVHTNTFVQTNKSNLIVCQGEAQGIKNVYYWKQKMKKLVVNSDEINI